MSRSNPTNGVPNPAVRWFEWNGEAGTVRYYDKEAKKNVDVGKEFSFLLLDQLATVRGWHKPSDSGIYANEVRDTTQDVLIVKAFKGGTIAEGLYRDIKDRVKVAGGQFVANCYIGFKHNGQLAIGSIRFKGSALGAWMEFEKAHRGELYKQAIAINGYTEGKTGRITFRVPVLTVKALSASSHEAAIALDKELQEFLAGYLKKTKRDQVEHVQRTEETVAEAYPDEPLRPEHEWTDEPARFEAPHEDEIPF